ncbi:Nucleoside diphosphate kinase 7 [Allomyces arbusculus]|nr:Nucleoside diphosphate kinase 7 [Allomyces arbusculus]
MLESRAQQDPAGLTSRLALHCEYHDPHADLIRRYLLFFYPHDNSVEMYDVALQRTFLKRAKYPPLKLADLVPGTAVSVFARQLHLTDYADNFTRAQLHKAVETVMVYVPDVQTVGHVLSRISTGSGGPATVQAIRAVTAEAVMAARLVSSPPRGTAVVVKVAAATATGAPPGRPASAPPHSPTLAAVADAAVAPCGGVRVTDERAFDALMRAPRPARDLKDASLLVVKPHAVAQGHVGAILRDLVAGGFQIVDMQSFTLAKPDAEDFLEIYKGVLPEYHMMVQELTAGPLVAVHVTHSTQPVRTVPLLRDLCGPDDPDLANVLRPRALRAQYGHDKVHNAVHCTDLPDDARLEVDFFFQIMAA